MIVSSLAAMIGDQRKEDPEYVFDESDWNENPGSHYSRSKVEAEKAAWDFVKEDPEFSISVVCPSCVLGPVLHPSSLSTVGRVVSYIKGEFNDSMRYCFFSSL